MNQLLRKPSAWLPIAMSLVAVAILLGYVALYGVAQQPQADEGTAAHLFQLLMGGQVPIVAFFALRWVPEMPKQALQVLALQILTALAPLALLFFFEM